MSSDALVAVTVQAGDRPGETPRNRRQEETFRKVLAAGIEMLREKSYADLTVRAVAARAKVAPATAYTYFSSKNHLIAEVYLDLVQQVPVLHRCQRPHADPGRQGAAPSGAGGRRRTRSRGRLHDRAARRRHRSRGARGARPDRRRDPPPHRIGRRPGRRPAHCVRARDDVLRRAGQAGSGDFTYHQIADRLGYVVGLILGARTRLEKQP